MKKIVCTLLLMLGSYFIFAQVKTDSTRRITPVKMVAANQLKIIPVTKATLIRKDAVQLKLQVHQFSDSVSTLLKDIDAQVNSLKDKSDNMSEMGEMESLRLQMAMDRMSKMMSTLSNIMKKMSETSEGITQNLK